MSICGTKPGVNTLLISVFLQMVSVRVTGEWCLLIILKQIPQERIQEPQGHIVFPKTEERADSTVSMSLLGDYAQFFCKALCLCCTSSLFLIFPAYSLF